MTHWPLTNLVRQNSQVDLAFRALTGNQQPDNSRISKLRRNLDALKGLYRCAEACGYVQFLRLSHKSEMVSLGHVALDGTKVQANASQSQGHEPRADA